MARPEPYDGGGKQVYYTGDVNHTVFEGNLETEAGGKKLSWTFAWGDSTLRKMAGTTGTSGTPYSIKITNDSSIDNANAIVFQQDPSLPSDVVSLAWLTKMCHVGSWVTLSWTLDFCFVWGQTGTLSPGVNYVSGDVVPADLVSNNQITLSYIDNGFEFGPISANKTQGSLFVPEDTTVPGFGNPNQGNVGIGMYGKGTFVCPTQATGPGGGRQFTIHPQYWVAFGNFQAGEVVDESVLYFPYEVEFKDGTFNADCTFDGQKWTVVYS
jgi:hypothetical protein